MTLHDDWLSSFVSPPPPQSFMDSYYPSPPVAMREHFIAHPFQVSDRIHQWPFRCKNKCTFKCASDSFDGRLTAK